MREKGAEADVDTAGPADAGTGSGRGRRMWERGAETPAAAEGRQSRGQDAGVVVSVVAVAAAAAAANARLGYVREGPCGRCGSRVRGGNGEGAAEDTGTG